MNDINDIRKRNEKYGERDEAEGNGKRKKDYFSYFIGRILLFMMDTRHKCNTTKNVLFFQRQN